MTFEEYRRKKEQNAPRSWAVTITMTIIALLAFTTFSAFALGIVQNGLTALTTLGAICALAIALYAVVCAFDGKRKTAQQAAYDILLIGPFF